MTDIEDFPNSEDIETAQRLVVAECDMCNSIATAMSAPVSWSPTHFARLVLDTAWRIYRNRVSRETTAKWEAENARKGGMPFEQDTFNP